MMRYARIDPKVPCTICRKPCGTHTDPLNPEMDHLDPTDTPLQHRLKTGTATQADLDFIADVTGVIL